MMNHTLRQKLKKSLSMQRFHDRELPQGSDAVKTLFYIRGNGSFTVEAAMAAPLFVFFLALFLGLFRVLSVEIQVNEALQYAAGSAAAASHESGEDADSIVETLLSGVGADALFYKQLSAEGCQSDFLKGGFVGISVSTAESDEQYVVVTADYEIRLPVAFFGKQYVEVSQYASARKWNGYLEDDGTGDDTYVYVTKYGTVYHKNTSCSYLDLSIQMVSVSQLDTLRNKSGGIYYACTSCDAGQSDGTVYITDYGTEYHSSLSCSALKRTVYKIALSEVGSRNACDKCYDE